MEEQSQVLDVVHLGHPVLRQKAEPVSKELFGSTRLKELAEGMVETMIQMKGVGLAAPQVGEPLRLFAYWVPGDDEQLVEPTVLVNPEIRQVGAEQEDGWEGCLSIPGLLGRVPRFVRVKVKAQDITGAPVSLTADYFHARVIQHENDHLDGVVYLDRMQSMSSLAFEKEWKQHNPPEE